MATTSKSSSLSSSSLRPERTTAWSSASTIVVVMARIRLMRQRRVRVKRHGALSELVWARQRHLDVDIVSADGDLLGVPVPPPLRHVAAPYLSRREPHGENPSLPPPRPAAQAAARVAASPPP